MPTGGATAKAVPTRTNTAILEAALAGSQIGLRSGLRLAPLACPPRLILNSLLLLTLYLGVILCRTNSCTRLLSMRSPVERKKLWNTSPAPLFDAG